MKIELFNVNMSKLHDEFIAVGLRPFPVIEHEDGTITFEFPDDADETLIQSIIDNHDPTPLPPPKTELELLKESHLDLWDLILFGE